MRFVELVDNGSVVQRSSVIVGLYQFRGLCHGVHKNRPTGKKESKRWESDRRGKAGQTAEMGMHHLNLTFPTASSTMRRIHAPLSTQWPSLCLTCSCRSCSLVQHLVCHLSLTFSTFTIPSFGPMLQNRQCRPLFLDFWISRRSLMC